MWNKKFIEQPHGSQQYPDFKDIEIEFSEGNCVFEAEEKTVKTLWKNKTKNSCGPRPMYNGHDPKGNEFFVLITPYGSVPYLGKHIPGSKNNKEKENLFKKWQKEAKEFAKNHPEVENIPYVRKTFCRNPGHTFSYLKDLNIKK